MDSTIEQQIDRRKASIPERMPNVMREITQRFALFQGEAEKKLHEALTMSGSRRAKVIKIQQLTSEVRALASPYAACQNGCSNCCYQLVMLSQTEADAIGHHIGRRAAQLSPSYKIPAEHSFGRNTPCSFLVGGSCSIYDYRPFTCRNLVNLDVDNLLCGFENWELEKANDPRFTGFPKQDPGPLLDAYKKISSADAVGDIRDFFPPTE
jgi:hypothetical protein